MNINKLSKALLHEEIYNNTIVLRPQKVRDMTLMVLSKPQIQNYRINSH